MYKRQELDTWTKEELFPEQREKFSFSVMVQELLADGIGVTSMEKIGQWLCDALQMCIRDRHKDG